MGAGPSRRLPQPRPGTPEVPTAPPAAHTAWRLSHFIKIFCLLVYLSLWLFEGMESALVTAGAAGGALVLADRSWDRAPSGKACGSGTAPRASPWKGQQRLSQTQSLRQGFGMGRVAAESAAPAWSESGQCWGARRVVSRL